MFLEIISKKQPQVTNKPSILFIHGACMGAWVWEGNFMEYFFEKGHSVFAINLSNHGKSEGERSLRWTSIKHYVRNLGNAVDSIDGPVFLVGHSMGGFAIQHYLLSPAKNVVGAALLCSAPSHGLWHLMGKLVLHYPFHFVQSVLQMSWLPVMKNKKRLQRVMFREDFPPQKMSEVISLLQDESFLVFLEMGFLKLPKVKQLPVPVIIIGAENDYLISVADTTHMALRYGLPSHIIEGASHCLMLETGWDAVAEDIRKFAYPH